MNTATIISRTLTAARIRNIQDTLYIHKYALTGTPLTGLIAQMESKANHELNIAMHDLRQSVGLRDDYAVATCDARAKLAELMAAAQKYVKEYDAGKMSVNQQAFRMKNLLKMAEKFIELAEAAKKHYEAEDERRRKAGANKTTF